MGGEGGGESMMAGFGEEGPPAPSSGEAPQSGAESEILVQLQPPGGGPPLVSLEAGKPYEVRYVGALHPVQGYTLFARGAQGAAVSAAPASRDAWSSTGLFDAVALSGDLPIACGGDESADSCHRVIDDQPSGQPAEAPDGYLCDFAGGAAGNVTLEVTLYFTDEVAQATYLMSGMVTVSVVP
jgi:hypothetical protein